MADIQYLNYGDQQIEQQALLNNLANQVQGYVQSQPWSNKRKEKFMSAYSDLMNRGILGASNNTGQWMVDVNGDPLPEMSRKDKEMYQEAAYFIQQQMAALPTKTAEEEKKVEDLPVFDFNKDFITHVNNSINGGQPLNIGYGDSDQWNYLDERDSNGIRGRKNRAKKLAELLESYKTKLGDGSKYKFEGSPYSDINDFNTKIDRAIAALKTDSIDDDREALQAIGLNQATWFNNGSGDPSGKVDADGNLLTYGQLAEQQEQKTLEEQKQQEKSNQQNRIKNSGVLTISANNNPLDAVYNAQKYQEHLGTTYGVGQTGFNSINDKVQELLERSYNGGKGNGLNNAERKQLGNLIHYIRTNNPNYQNYNLSRQDEAELSKHESLKGKRLQDFVRLPWQTSDGRYTYADKSGNIYFLKPQNQAKLAAPTFQRSAAYNDYKNNFLKGSSLMNKQQRDAYLKSRKDGLTSAEWEELASIGFDIASIVDPEMFSAAGLALTGSGLRHHAAASQPGGMSTSDKWWQAADYGLSILGSIPVLGDTALAARAVNNLKKAIVPLGIVMAGANVPQAAKAAYNKVVNGQDLTIQDWRAIGAVLTAAVGVGRGRQMSKRAEALRRTGGGSQKTITEGTVKTDKGEIKGLSEKTTKELQKSFKKAGNDNEAKTKALRENAEVQTKAKEQGIKLEEASITSESSWRNKAPSWMRSKKQPEITTGTRTESTGGNRIATLRAMAEFNKNHGWLARKGLAEQDWVFRRTGGYTSNPHRGLWQSVKDYFGKSKWDDFGQRQSTSQTSSNNQNAPTGNQNNTVNQNAPTGKNAKPKPPVLSKEDSKELQSTLRGKNFSTNETKEAPMTVKGFGDIYGIKDPSGKYSLEFELKDGSRIKIDPKDVKDIKSETLKTLRKDVMKKIDTQVPKENRSKIKFELIRQLKLNGYLKQGGTIDKQRIQRYKNYINK